MAELDSDQEVRRLAALYAGMEDSQLVHLAQEAFSITDESRQALQSELFRRGLDVSLNFPAPILVPELRKLVSVAQFRDTPEALLAKGRLEAAGIECFFANENLIRLDWFISNLLGGIKILVDESNAAEARAVIEQPISEGFDVDGTDYYEQPKCPQCGSLDIGFQGVDKRFALPALWALSLPIPIARNRWKCSTCGHEWKEGRSQEPGSGLE